MLGMLPQLSPAAVTLVSDILDKYILSWLRWIRPDYPSASSCVEEVWNAVQVESTFQPNFTYFALSTEVLFENQPT